MAVTGWPPTTLDALSVMPVGDGGRTVTVAVAVAVDPPFVPASALVTVMVDVTGVRVTRVEI